MLHRAFRAAAPIFVVTAIATVTFGLAAPAAVTHAGVQPVAAPANVDPPPITVNPFIPEDRGISDCISALPKPGCGSEARGGWRQGLILLALVGGLSIIGWRIVAGVRRGQRPVGSPQPGADPRPGADRPDGPPPPATMHSPSGQPVSGAD